MKEKVVGIIIWGGGGEGGKGYVAPPPLKLMGGPPPSLPTYVHMVQQDNILHFAVMIAAIASVFVGYRIIAVFGSVLVLAGFLSASFVNPGDNIELMGFLVGFLGGKMFVKP